MASRDDDQLWELVHAERAALIADLADVPEERWKLPSLSEGWTVHDVTAHLVGNADFRWSELVTGMVRSRFNFDRMNQRDMEAHRGVTPADTLASLRRVATLTRTPPAARASRLVEEVVHGEDVRRPLGLARAYPTAAVVPALEYQLATSDSIGGARRRLGGVHLVATDVTFTHGQGPEVRGPVLELLMLAAGRTSAVVGVEGLEHLGD